MSKYTIKDARNSFNRLAAVMGKTTEHYEIVDPASNNGNRYKAIIGGWELDYNPTYGGCVITEICNESGGTRYPFGGTRRTPAEFCSAVDFALNALHETSGN